jgi:hypothetical protein
MGTYYRNAEQFLDKIDRGVWIEIGTERGEGSTRFFAGLAKDRATKFYGVDAMADQIEKSTKLLEVDGKLPDHVELVHALGEEFLEKLAGEIGEDRVSLVYLDNFDWDYWLGMQEEAFVAGVKQRYVNEMNIEMTNLNSQRAHLLQAMWLNTISADNCLVICDDTWYHPHEGIFTGKCSGAIPFLLTQGFELLHTEGYRQNSGVILGKFKD